MKLRKISTEEYIELPESGEYELTSAERVDLRPKETREVKTGLEILANKDDEAFVYGELAAHKIYVGRGYEEIVVTMTNPTDKLIPIHVGDEIATLSYNVDKTATLDVVATFTEEEPDVETFMPEEMTANDVGE